MNQLEIHIQKQLLNFYNIMIDTEHKRHIHCDMLREYLKHYPTEDAFHLDDLNDTAYFLQYLLDVLYINDSIVLETLYGTESEADNPKKSSMVLLGEKRVKHSIIFESDMLPILDSNKSYKISKFLTTREDKEDNEYNENNFDFPRIIKDKTLVESPLIIFRINRYFDDDIFYKTRVIPTKNLILKNETKVKYFLKSIVVYRCVHYTCYFRCKNFWYYYDDARSKIEFVGDYEKLLLAEPSPITQGILYFYEKYA